MFGLVVFRVRVGKFAEEVRFVAPLAPRLGEIRACRARGPPNLAGERPLFFCRPAFRNLKEAKSKRVYCVIAFQVSEMIDLHRAYQSTREYHGLNRRSPPVSGP